MTPKAANITVIMNTGELRTKLDELRKLSKETEWIEFKKAENSFHSDKLGEYFSALSNEANLKGKDSAWLIFGIRDTDRKIVGTNYRAPSNNLDTLKSEIANHTNNRITFVEIHELLLPEGRVIMFQIPPASKGIPTGWKGHYYGREGESINALSVAEFEHIRNQNKSDWSAQICENATINDLDPNAITKAREEYKKKNASKAQEVDTWDDAVFLNKAKITINGQITTAAIILLGKPESEHFISPSVAQISWILKNEANSTTDYEHFGPPFILNSNSVFARIRNLKCRYLLEGTLFPTEIDKYEPYVIREALHNCIAHADYELNENIVVEEKPEELTFANAGMFMPGSVEKVIQENRPQPHRNPFLAAAMLNFGMIDIIGSGIVRMFMMQKERFFPLPDYDLTQPERVIVKIQGQILNERYTQLLIKNRDMDLSTVMLLDKVQKGVRLSKVEHKILKVKQLVEGRYPNLLVASKLANTTEEKVKYIRQRGFDKKYYVDLICEFVKKNEPVTRQDINVLIYNKLPDVLTHGQKNTKINNLLKEMSQRGILRNAGSKKYPRWLIIPSKKPSVLKTNEK
jgi:ATP-dependent DNA helicase RecG